MLCQDSGLIVYAGIGLHANNNYLAIIDEITFECTKVNYPPMSRV